MKYFYDFHIHSCLSPCADNDMTPNNIAGVLKLAGIKVAALTDHNTLKNCPAFFEAAKRYGIIPIAGTEVTTSEDIHVVCLFKELEEAMDFDSELYTHRTLIKNRTDVFGEQLILDENDEIVGSELHFLTNATDLSVDDLPKLVKSYGGICYPAHIDRESNGIIAILGTFPEDIDYACVEFHNPDNRESYKKSYPALDGKKTLYGSDAHFLWSIEDAKYYFDLEVPKEDPSIVKERIFDCLSCDLGGAEL